MTTRTGLYLRISDDRTGREAGVGRQREDTTASATQAGETIVAEYVDNDLSAWARRKPRPAYRQMLDDMRTGRLDRVRTWHPDRLYRQPVELEELVTLIEQSGTTILTVRAGEVDLTTPSGRLAARNMAAVNAYMVEHNAENWKRSVVANRKAGKWSNARDRLFGYERDGKINPDEAERLRWIAAQVLGGRSFVSICNELIEDGSTTTRGNRWSPHALRQLLMNPRIAGYATHKGEIVGQGQWQPVLDPGTWERVQAALYPTKVKGPRRALLTRLVWCCCGTMMHSSARYAGTKRPTIRTYRCPVAPPYNLGCGKLSIAAEPLEDIAIGHAQAKLDDPRFIAALESRRNLGGQLGAVRREVDELEARHRELTMELKSTRGRTAAAIVEALDDVDAQLDGARRRLLGAIAPELPDLSEGWPSDVETQNALIGMTFERIIIHPTRTPGRGFKPDRVEIVPLTA